MKICSPVIDVLEVILRFVVVFVTTVIRTVCKWVSSVLKVMKEVCEWVHEKVCKWLPWPLSELCNWVTKQVCRLIEVFETIWKWVCENILEKIITILEYFVTYLIYVLRWVCFFIDFITLRWWQLLLCMSREGGMLVMPVCPVILVDEEGNQASTVDQVNRWMEEANRIFAQCNIRLEIEEIRIVKTKYANGSSCNFGGIFSGFFNWFSTNAKPGCVTVYFVNDIEGACGCAYPGASWVTISGVRDVCGEGNVPCVIAQEIGHLADLWAHSDTPGNVMHNPCGEKFTKWQCCMIRTSRFVSAMTHGSKIEAGPVDHTHDG